MISRRYHWAARALWAAAFAIGVWNVFHSHGWQRAVSVLLFVLLIAGLWLTETTYRRWREAKWQAMAMSRDPLGAGAAWDFVDSLSLRQFKIVIDWMVEHAPDFDVDENAPDVVKRMERALQPPEEP